MTDEDRIMDAVVRWEERRAAGEVLEAEQLCPDHPALWEALRARIEKRRRLLPFFEQATVIPSPAPAVPPLPSIPGFEILERVGQGGMGVIYKARQVKLNRVVALKMLFADAPGPHRERFRIEAESIARLEHPNIDRLYEIGECAGRSYLVLEWADGGSLAQFLNGTPMHSATAASILLPLARAVEYAHERGVVHRDLKPANVLLSSPSPPRPLSHQGERGSAISGSPPPLSGRGGGGGEGWGTLKIADFGLAKRLDEDQGQTQTGAVLGTPNYMAPEQALGKIDEIGPWTDVYALGAILYEMLTGRPPFVGKSVLATLELVKEHDPVPPTQLQPDVARDLEVICLKCLSKLPGDRYASAAVLAADLESFLAGEPIAGRTLTTMERFARFIQHHKLDERVGPLGTATLILAPIIVGVQVLAYALFWSWDYFPEIILAINLTTTVVMRMGLVLAKAPILRVVTPPVRRRVVAAAVTNTLGMILAPLFIWLRMPPDEHERLYLAYPLFVILGIHTMATFAGEISTFYVEVTVSLAVAALMLCLPFWSPLIAGVLAGGHLAFIGLFFRSVRRDALRQRGGGR